MSMKMIFKLLASLFLCLGAGWTGSFFTRDAVINWYPELLKPAFNPPAWVFAPVWTVLYFLMGIALFLVWKKGFSTFGVSTAITVFLIQLVFNVAWSVVFFGLHSILGGLGVIAFLWLLIVLTIYVFAPVSVMAAWLLVPYLIWVSFASFLNLSLWFLNG